MKEIFTRKNKDFKARTAKFKDLEPLYSPTRQDIKNKRTKKRWPKHQEKK